MAAPINRSEPVLRPKKRSASSTGKTPARKGPRSALDDYIATLELQYELDFPTEQEKEHNVQVWNNKHRADDL